MNAPAIDIGMPTETGKANACGLSNLHAEACSRSPTHNCRWNVTASMVKTKHLAFGTKHTERAHTVDRSILRLTAAAHRRPGADLPRQRMQAQARNPSMLRSQLQ